jgi:hypothetical protein
MNSSHQELPVTFGVSKEKRNTVRSNALTHITVPLDCTSNQYAVRLYYTVNNQKTWKITPMRVSDPKGATIDAKGLIINDKSDISFKMCNVKSDVAKPKETPQFKFVITEQNEPPQWTDGETLTQFRAIQSEPFSIETGGKKKTPTQKDEVQDRLASLEEQVKRIPELEETVRALQQQLKDANEQLEAERAKVAVIDPERDVSELANEFESVTVNWEGILL